MVTAIWARSAYSISDLAASSALGRPGWLDVAARSALARPARLDLAAQSAQARPGWLDLAQLDWLSAPASIEETRQALEVARSVCKKISISQSISLSTSHLRACWTDQAASALHASNLVIIITIIIVLL